MKILHFGCAYKPYRGGSRVRLEKLVTHCNEKDIRLSLITHTLSDSREDDYPFSEVLRLKSANNIFPSFKIFLFLKSQKPNVVILHNSRVLLVWFLFYRFLFPKIGVVCELHSVREATRLKQIVNGSLYRRCDRLVVLSSGAKEWVRHHYGLKNSVTIVNGTDSLPASNSTIQTNYNPASVHYVYAGSFHEWQGVLVLAKAVRKLGKKHWLANRLTLIGDGPAMLRVREILGHEMLALDTVKLMGWTDSETVRSIQSEADFLLAPRPSTVATETVVPLKVVDSVTLRRPLVASRVGGITEFLNGEDSSMAAILVNPNDVDDLACTLRQPPDEKEYSLIVKNLEKLSRQIPTWEKSSSNYIKVLRGVMFENER